MLTDEQFKPGDIVTRVCDDEHEVIDVDHYYGIMEVRCIKPSSVLPGCWEIGDEESNLVRRYRLVRRKDSD